MSNERACPKCGSPNISLSRHYRPGARYMAAVPLCADCGHEGTRGSVAEAHAEFITWLAESRKGAGE